jgi:hypothetical protein
MKNYYIWTGHKIIGVDDFYLSRYRHAFIYEPRAPEFASKWKVLFKGALTKRAKKHMPKEFLMHLLLMGVPT